MSILIDNLKEAINGESNAKRKYELYAEQAEKENYEVIAHLFRATAKAESYHIKNHLKALSTILKMEVNPNDFVEIKEEELKNKVKNTKSNLIDAIGGELYEHKHMYKTFLRNAIKHENDVVELTFSLARKAEKIHAKLYSSFLKKLERNRPFKSIDIYVCIICGNVELISAPDICKICDHNKKFYEKS